jgi:hypothetical protein
MSVFSRVGVVMAAAATALLASFATAPAANAAYQVTPVGPTWAPDGPVHAVLPSPDGLVTYVGGSFTGGVAAVDASTGELEWLGNANGDVRAPAMGPNNATLLIGGAFTAVDGATHRKLAALTTADGKAVSNWKGSAGGTVRDIVVVGSTAYFGGLFKAHAGQAQVGLGAVSAATGKLVPAFTTSTDGKVYGLAAQGDRLFIAGRFTAVDGQTRNQLASVSLGTNSTGIAPSLDAWAPAPSCSDVTKCNVNWDVTADAGAVYVVGRNPGAVYAVNLSDARPKWTKGPGTVVSPTGSVVANGDAQAVTLGPDGKLYVGGHFTSIAGGQPRVIMAALNPANGALDPSFSGARFIGTFPGVWAVAATATRLEVGGHFSAAGPKVGRVNVKPYLALFPVG